jgi:uncharacterized protein YbaR (Trm112 family)
MAASEISAELMEILRCPRCRGELSPRPQLLTCAHCQLGFAVQEGVPNFLLEDAQPLSPERGGR